MKLLRFTRHYDVYNAGEIAGFEDPHAADLVSRGIAALIVDKPAIVKDVPAEIERSAPTAADEIDDEDLEAPGKSRGRRKI